MRVLLTEVSYFNYHLVDSNGTRISSDKEFLGNHTILQFSFEGGDTPEVFKGLRQIVEEYCLSTPILFSFAHLTNMHPTLRHAKEMFEKLREEAWTQKYHLIPFGVHKIFNMVTTFQTNKRFFRFFSSTPIKCQLNEQIDLHGQTIEYSELYDLEVIGKQFEIPREREEHGMRWEPFAEKGAAVSDFRSAFMRRAIENYTMFKVASLDFATTEISGTNLFKVKGKPILSHLKAFGVENSYFVEGRKEYLVLTHAGCYQAFSFMSSLPLRKKVLPLGVYELASCSRKEKSGECQLMYRHTQMKMVDLHVLFDYQEQFQSTFKKLYEKIQEIFSEIGLEMQTMISFGSKEKMDRHISFLLDYFPNIITKFNEGSDAYWDFNIEIHALDPRGKPVELATIQLDLKNPTNYGIELLEGPGTELGIFHVALFGTIERAEYMLTGLPKIPFTFSPHQLLIMIPVTDDEEYTFDPSHFENFSVSLDDRNISLSKKIKQSYETPYHFRMIAEKGGKTFMDYETKDVFTAEQLVQRMMSKNIINRSCRGFVQKLSEDLTN